MIDDFLAAARSCIGTPFRHQGRLPGIGLDCVGLVIVAAQAVGLQCRDRAGYSLTPSNGLLQSALGDHADVLRPVQSWKPGDVLLMCFFREPQHLAIITDKDTIIHSYSTVGQVCEHAFSENWRRRVLGVYRLVTA